MTRPPLTRGELCRALDAAMGEAWRKPLAHWSGINSRTIERWRSPDRDPSEPIGGEGLRDALADALDGAAQGLADAARSIRDGPR